MNAIAAALLLATAVGDRPADDVSVSVQEVSDNRTSRSLPSGLLGGFSKGLNLRLKIAGGALSEATGVMPLEIHEARSDIGEDLLDPGSMDHSFAFLSLHQLQGKAECVLDVRLKNPARRARSVFISGTVTLYAPRDRPTEKIVIKKYRDHAGKALDHPELQRRGIQMTVTTSEKTPPRQVPRPGGAYSSRPSTPPVPAVKGAVPMTVLPDAAPSSLVPLPRDNPPAPASGNENAPPLVPVAEPGTLGEAFAGAFTKMLGFGTYDLTVDIVDPKDQIYGFQLFNEAGKLVGFNGWSCSSGPSVTRPLSIDGLLLPDAEAESDEKRCEFAVRGELPKNGYLVLHLSTDDNLRKIPFSATVVLP